VEITQQFKLEKENVGSEGKSREHAFHTHAVSSLVPGLMRGCSRGPLEMPQLQQRTGMSGHDTVNGISSPEDV